MEQSFVAMSAHINIERSAQSIERPSQPFVLRIRFQLLSGLLICVVLPILLRWQFDVIYFRQESFYNALFGAAMAIVAAYFIHRRFNELPGVNAGSSIIFIYTAVFLIVMVVFLISRLDYSRYVFLASYALAIFWFVGLHLATAHLTIPLFAIVPGGNAATLSDIGSVRWDYLKVPSLQGAAVKAVVADLRHNHSPEWDRFIADCSLAGIPVYHSKQVKEALTGRVEIEHLSENSFGSLLPDLTYLKIKQILDFLLAAAVFPLFLIVYAVVAALTVWSSGWPVLFLQERVGYGGRSFLIYKFRTMRPSSTKRSTDAAITRDGDSRITPLGRVLRRYRIDELPQIINILRGEMSWIGPRPEAVPLSKAYEKEIAFYRYRHVVRPGISGWAQVNQGHVAATEQVRDKLYYDFFYIKNISPWLDILIVLKTIRTVLTGFGAK